MKYHVTYDVTLHPEGVEREKIPEGHGACDAIILHSIILPTDGAYSHALLSRDGKTGDDLKPMDMFTAWVMMAKRLSEAEGLADGARGLAEDVFQAAREAVMRAKKDAKSG